jgi:hypothetical protein
MIKESYAMTASRPASACPWSNGSATGTTCPTSPPPDKRRLTVRVVEYDVRKPDASTSQLFCLLTTLTDEQQYSKQDIADLYPHRWVAVETTIGETKSTITDAGPSRGPILRSETPDPVRQEIWA